MTYSSGMFIARPLLVISRTKCLVGGLFSRFFCVRCLVLKFLVIPVMYCMHLYVFMDILLSDDQRDIGFYYTSRDAISTNGVRFVLVRGAKLRPAVCLSHVLRCFDAYPRSFIHVRE